MIKKGSELKTNSEKKNQLNQVHSLTVSLKSTDSISLRSDIQEGSCMSCRAGCPSIAQMQETGLSRARGGQPGNILSPPFLKGEKEES